MSLISRLTFIFFQALYYHAIINIKNNDSCLFYSINSPLDAVSDHSDILSKNHNTPSYLKTDGNDFPTPISQIPKVEKKNNQAITVYGYTISNRMEKVGIFQYHNSEQQNEMQRSNLLLTSENVEVVNDKSPKERKKKNIITHGLKIQTDYSLIKTNVKTKLL